MSNHPKEAAIGLPMRCSGCPAQTVWDEKGACKKCGLSQNEMVIFLSEARQSYDRARILAAEGRWEESLRAVEEARRDGLADLLPVRRLSTICRAVLGDWRNLESDILPEEWRPVVAVDSSVRADYSRARNTARQEKWDEAALLTDLVVAAAPWLLPAQRLRQIIRTANPPEIESPKSQTADSPIPLPVVPTSVFTPKDRRLLLGGLATVGMSSAVAMGLAAFAVWRTGDTVSPVARQAVSATFLTAAPKKHSGLIAKAKKRKSLPLLPADLRREHSEADLILARRWFNSAVTAMRGKRYERAATLAQAVYTLAPNSYLADEALWLRAQAADNAGNENAPYLYREVAGRTPHSPYAVLALRRARQITTMQQADARVLQVTKP